MRKSSHLTYFPRSRRQLQNLHTLAIRPQHGHDEGCYIHLFFLDREVCNRWTTDTGDLCQLPKNVVMMGSTGQNLDLLSGKHGDWRSSCHGWRGGRAAFEVLDERCRVTIRTGTERNGEWAGWGGLVSSVSYLCESRSLLRWQPHVQLRCCFRHGTRDSTSPVLRGAGKVRYTKSGSRLVMIELKCFVAFSLPKCSLNHSHFLPNHDPYHPLEKEFRSFVAPLKRQRERG